MILGYYEDGPNLVSMAMNGWGAAEPAWWLNLQAHPQAVVELAGGIRREVLGRPAVGAERERLWQRWRELDKNLDGYAARRPQETAVVVLEPTRRPNEPVVEGIGRDKGGPDRRRGCCRFTSQRDPSRRRGGLRRPGIWLFSSAG